MGSLFWLPVYSASWAGLVLRLSYELYPPELTVKFDSQCVSTESRVSGKWVDRGCGHDTLTSGSLSLFLCFLSAFETRFCSVAQTSLELNLWPKLVSNSGQFFLNLLSVSYRGEPPCSFHKTAKLFLFPFLFFWDSILCPNALKRRHDIGRVL